MVRSANAILVMFRVVLPAVAVLTRPRGFSSEHAFDLP
jgi:hypothetical protein